MTLRQKQYALNIVRFEGDENKARSLPHAKAPITKKQAEKWLQDPDFKDYRKDIENSVGAAVGVDAVFVLDGYKKLYLDSVKGDAKYDKDGNFIAMRPDRTNAGKALDSMSRILGLDAPKEVNINVDLSTWLTQETIKPLIPKDVIDVETD